MTAEPWLLHGVNWLLTYLLHSTVLLGAAWIITSLLPSRLDATRETLWKFALVGGLVSATVQIGFEPSGWAARLNLPTSLQLDVGSLISNELPLAGAQVAVTPDSLPAADDSPSQDVSDGIAGLEVPPPAFEADSRRPDESGPNAALAWVTRRLVQGSPWLFAVVLAASVSAMALALHRLRRTLSGRCAVSDERVLAIFSKLCRRADVRRRVRLTYSPRLASPVALGVLRAEICLPSRALGDLRDLELESMLAHELAHIVRSDPAWMLVGRALTTLLFVQPLNFVACRRLREIAEYRCDAWAAAQCDDAVALARCLTEVATWLVQARRSAVTRLLPGMSVHQSTLSRRVGRLLDEPPVAMRTARHNLLLFCLAAGLAMLAVLAPSVQAIVERPTRIETPRADEVTSWKMRVPPPTAGTIRADVRGPAGMSGIAPLAQLDLELDQLEAEVAGLKRSIAGTELEAELQPLVDQFEKKMASIRDRRARLDQDLAHASPRRSTPRQER